MSHSNAKTLVILLLLIHINPFLGYHASLSHGWRYSLSTISPDSVTANQRRSCLFSGTNEDTSVDSSSLASKPSVWTYFGDLASKTNACNLGQGFPDWDPPEFVTDAFQEVAKSSFHQYTRPSGHVPLVELIGQRYSRHLQRKIDPLNEIVITVGASQALYLTLLTLLKPNDEIVLFEPFFDLYLKQIKLIGAIPKFVRLGGDSTNPSDPWGIDLEKLRLSITPKTKVLLLNSPHNPTGKVFTKRELEGIAEIVKENPQLTVVSDEVYKFTIYNPIEEGDETAKGHYHFARFPGMWDRTITLSSCGKTFSVTGWQVGWMVGSPKYIKPVQDIIPCIQFCASTPVQQALTLALKQAELPYKGSESYYEWLRLQFQKKRTTLEKGLLASGITPLESQGGFFLMARLPKIDSVVQQAFLTNEEYDWEFCKNLALTKGVIGIPASPFVTKESLSTLGPMARFAFCKKDKTLHEAAERLSKGNLDLQYLSTKR